MLNILSSLSPPFKTTAPRILSPYDLLTSSGL